MSNFEQLSSDLENEVDKKEKLQQDFFDKMVLWLKAKRTVSDIKDEDLKNVEMILGDRNNENLRNEHEQIKGKLKIAEDEERRLAEEQRKLAEEIALNSKEGEAKLNVDQVYTRLVEEHRDLFLS